VDNKEYNLNFLPKYFKSLIASGAEYDGLLVMCDDEINVFDLMISLTLQRAQEGKFDL